MYLNELQNGFVIPHGLTRMVQELTTPQAFRRLCLGEKVNCTAALDLGIINGLYKDHNDLC